MDIRQRCHNPRIASLASFSAAITELLKLVHDINVIVLSHSLCSLIGPTKNVFLTHVDFKVKLPDLVQKQNPN